MDGTGSTVVIYKTEAGERLVLKDVVPIVEGGRSGKSGRIHPSNPLVRIARNVDEAVHLQQHHCSTASGRVMIIDEPPPVGASFGSMSDGIDCNTTVTAPAGAETTVDTWAKILLHSTPGEGSSKTNPTSNDMLAPVQTSNDVAGGKSSATHNYHLRFHVKMPAQSNKPA
ncbi:uncharacterized protein LOC126567614 [Anopheles maculipalpis]|uniref:uncharacterized protein LOC126567614 n=1 Tax=Anopheles maculipalpis TaxID=1496333 RepID=UPI0021592390|nr:uncharacterized protein LOC126567614 [Anopheles maculipalpis]